MFVRLEPCYLMVFEGLRAHQKLPVSDIVTEESQTKVTTHLKAAHNPLDEQYGD